MFTRWWTGDSLAGNRKKALLAGILGISLAVTSGCSLLPKEEEEEALPTIKPPQLSKKPEYAVTKDTLTAKVRGSGKLMSTTEEEVYFTEEGKRIKGVYVQTGDVVTAGTLIADLDVSELESNLRQKRLQTRSEELAMIELLRDPGEKSAADIEQAKIQFELKREEMVKLEEQIARSKVIAPIDGTVVAVYNQKGDLTKAYEAIATIADLSELTVAATLTQEDLKKVTVGMEVEVDINAAGTHKGKIKQLPNPNKANQNNNGGGFYDPNQKQVKDSLDRYLLVELEPFPENMNRGTMLSVAVIVQKKENAIVIPPAALRTVTGRNYVQVIDENGSKREVDVEVGMQTSTQVEILKGLTVGQKVVGR